MNFSEILDTLEDAIIQKPPFCTGTVPLASNDAILFYRRGENAEWIDLARATETKLEALSEACEPATFGLDQVDVLDESYRKAGKMDTENFAMNFDIDKLRIVDYVREQLLDGADEGKVLKAELYKLNVYMKDSFFKTHKDTPRGDTMFGSLVVAFPTLHEGGALVLRHDDQEWTFDSASLTREQAEPSVAYIAFFSDIDHEVTLVTSGYRVTLTYNLYLGNKTSQEDLPSSITPVVPDDHRLHAALSTALSNPTFLPKGGYLGFGLSFKYPINQTSKRTGLSAAILKGSDAVIDRVCRQLSLTTSLNVVYTEGDTQILVPAEELLSGDEFDDDILSILCEDYEGKVIREIGKDARTSSYNELYGQPVIRLAWVTALTGYSTFKKSYVAYGNQAMPGCMYGDLCLAVRVGPFGRRESPDSDSE
ncbi:hypothetical protein D9615_008856 [Tricholomella constricta]|uniref:Prolyl 4-hydroxylase alpha subunit Fe(2+) 2OG dioxygenase domain-containing protein n=1 Tax=Tricholomella constricta TaxID=117010 RepID=A0A8H5H024_9AGAR|nr:hypothetical protein D9615_008856 [Tricholomella constricta]